MVPHCTSPRAPECFNDSLGGISTNCDIFSFGVILWELVTQTRPWDGLSEFQVLGKGGHECQNKQHDGISFPAESPLLPNVPIAIMSIQFARSLQSADDLQSLSPQCQAGHPQSPGPLRIEQRPARKRAGHLRSASRIAAYAGPIAVAHPLKLAPEHENSRPALERVARDVGGDSGSGPRLT